MVPKPDVSPNLKGPQFFAWIAFAVAYLTGFLSATLVAMAALGLGIVRKGGKPQMNQAYLQSILLDENT